MKPFRHYILTVKDVSALYDRLLLTSVYFFGERETRGLRFWVASVVHGSLSNHVCSLLFSAGVVKNCTDTGKSQCLG